MSMWEKKQKTSADCLVSDCALPWQQAAASCPNKDRKAKRWAGIGNPGLRPLPASRRMTPTFPVGFRTCCQTVLAGRCTSTWRCSHNVFDNKAAAMTARCSHYRWFATSLGTCCRARSPLKRGVPPLLSSTRKQQEKHFCWCFWWANHSDWTRWEFFSVRHFKPIKHVT